MSTILKILVLVLAVVISFFMVWRRLREDYQDDQIFALSLGVVSGSLTGFILASLVTFIDLRFWMAVLGGFVSGFFIVKKLGMRYFEILEAGTPTLFVYLIFLNSTSFLIALTANLFSWHVVAKLLILILSLLMFFYFAKYFRRFLWYPSGKIGLASLSSLTFYSLSQVGLVYFLGDMLPWVGRILEVIIGASCGIGALAMIYLRSGRHTGQDFRLFNIRRRR